MSVLKQQVSQSLDIPNLPEVPDELDSKGEQGVDRVFTSRPVMSC